MDLFSRIKNTEQAEEVLTVLFASKQLKSAGQDVPIFDADILSYILNWKKAWDTKTKREAIKDPIRSLIVLGWMRVELTERIDDAA